jgi:hypothetical protein
VPNGAGSARALAVAGPSGAHDRLRRGRSRTAQRPGTRRGIASRSFAGRSLPDRWSPRSGPAVLEGVDEEPAGGRQIPLRRDQHVDELSVLVDPPIQIPIPAPPCSHAATPQFASLLRSRRTSTAIGPARHRTSRHKIDSNNIRRSSMTDQHMSSRGQDTASNIRAPHTTAGMPPACPGRRSPRPRTPPPLDSYNWAVPLEPGIFYSNYFRPALTAVGLLRVRPGGRGVRRCSRRAVARPQTCLRGAVALRRGALHGGQQVARP